MVLATAKIEDFDRFWNTFSTKGAEKRQLLIYNAHSNQYIDK